jgi:hypothetical protein
MTRSAAAPPRPRFRRCRTLDEEEVEGRAPPPPSSFSFVVALLLLLLTLLLLPGGADAEASTSRRRLRSKSSSSSSSVGVAGRASTTTTERGYIDIDIDDDDDDDGDVVDAYALLARSIRYRLDAYDSALPAGKHGIASASSALRSLSATQSALKRIDGAAHEVYQRTHRSSTSLDDGGGDEGVDDDDDDDDGSGDEDGGGGGVRVKGGVGGLKVAGRMSRNAARVGCVADALFAAELCELAGAHRRRRGCDDGDDDEEGTLAPRTGREVLLNVTIRSPDDRLDLAVSVLVMRERDYDGGAGTGHGGVDDLLSSARGGEVPPPSAGRGGGGGRLDDDEGTAARAPRGRFLVVLTDHRARCATSPSPGSTAYGGERPCDLSSIISILDAPPERLRLRPKMAGEDGGEIASVCEPLYRMAGELLEAIGPVLLSTMNATTSEGGSDDGNDDGESRSKTPAIHFVGHSLAGGVAAIAACIMDGTIPLRSKSEQNRGASLTGSGRDRTSALCLGPPPCLSPNLRAPFVTSVIHGDDIVCRTTQGTIDNLCDRTIRSIKGGLLGRSVGWMSEAVSLTVSGFKSNSGGKAERLVVPGQTFLVRPRRMGGGSSSIHEVGGRGGESLRAALLWQLNDVLLSKSLWSHHRLDAYVRSLDRVRLKGFVDDQSIE